METKGFIYYDDSMHDSYDFYLGAFVYSENDLNNEISKIISDCGLDPYNDEFKSSIGMDQNPKYKKIRTNLREFILSKKIAIVISPPNGKDFQEITCNAIVQLIENNKTKLKFPLEIFIDQGIIRNKSYKNYKSITETFDKNDVIVNIEQDSKIIKGIQLADYVAHSCSVMLKEKLGIINKTTKEGFEMGYNTEIEIGFELWAYLRNCFFSVNKPQTKDSINNEIFEVIVENHGLFISPNCSAIVKKKSIERFGKMYLGCTH